MNFIGIVSLLKKNMKFFKNKILFVMYIIRELRRSFVDYVHRKDRIFELKKLMKNANSYDEWKNLASELDELEGKFKWKAKKETSLYNWRKVEQLIDMISKKRESMDLKALVHILRANLDRNLHYITSPTLYEISNIGTKLQIEILQDEIMKALETIYSSDELSFNTKFEFFSEVRHHYGRTALLLSGGASLGMYHTGVIKLLYENDLLPKIICGSSAGSIVAAIIGTSRMEDIPKLHERGLKLAPFELNLKDFSFLRKMTRFIFTGEVFDTQVLKEFLRENIGDFTFQEAYDRTGFILNVTVTGYTDHENNVLLNYLSAPNVLIWSAVAASCAVPQLFSPVELVCKNEHGVMVPYNCGHAKYVDGSISLDLPMKRLSELFNVNNFIVSQTNPHVLPLITRENYNDNKKFYIKETGKFYALKILKTFLYDELNLRLTQLSSLGILPAPLEFFHKLFKQQYHGDVTICPVPTIKDYLKVLKNPTKEMIDDCCAHSLRQTYPKMNKIEGLLKIEVLLEKLYFKLKYKHNKQKFNGDKKYLKEDKIDQKIITYNNCDLFESIDKDYNKLIFLDPALNEPTRKNYYNKSKRIPKTRNTINANSTFNANANLFEDKIAANNRVFRNPNPLDSSKLLLNQENRKECFIIPRTESEININN